jgi:hypothetical protein
MSGSLKYKVYKTNPHTLEDPRHNTAARFKHFPGKNSRELTTLCSAGTLSAFGQEDNIFSICCSTGEFLLHFLKVVINAIASDQIPSPTETRDSEHERPSAWPPLLVQEGK